MRLQAEGKRRGAQRDARLRGPPAIEFDKYLRSNTSGAIVRIKIIMRPVTEMTTYS